MRRQADHVSVRTGHQAGFMTMGRYLCRSGCMVAAPRSEFGPLPDQSICAKTRVRALIEQLHIFLKQPTPARSA